MASYLKLPKREILNNLASFNHHCHYHNHNHQDHHCTFLSCRNMLFSLRHWFPLFRNSWFNFHLQYCLFYWQGGYIICETWVNERQSIEMTSHQTQIFFSINKTSILICISYICIVTIKILCPSKVCILIICKIKNFIQNNDNNCLLCEKKIYIFINDLVWFFFGVIFHFKYSF